MVVGNLAKWNELARRFGSKSGVLRLLQRLVREGVFDELLQ
ncbi:hypothetical protein [Limisphaera sp. 4302-co]